MPQLVGSPCALCAETIITALGAAPCGACGQPRHDACVKPAADEAICATCGAKRGTDQQVCSRLAALAADARMAERHPEAWRRTGSAGRGARGTGGAMAFVALVIGVTIVAAPWLFYFLMQSFLRGAFVMP